MNKNKIKGDDGDNVIAGTPNADDINGKKGDDTIHADAGNDKVKGDKGNDNLFGDSGMDVLLGGDDNDQLSGGTQDDLLDGGKDDDELFGNEGNDILAGNKGSDTLLGGDGDDVLLGDGKLKGSGKGWGGGAGSGGGTGKDSASDGAEWNKWATVGGSGSGGSGETGDYLDGGAGNDLLFAGGGNDTGHYQVTENVGSTDTYDGGDGIDTLELELTLNEWKDPVFEVDLASYLQFLEDHADASSGEADDQAFTFNAFGLSASAWENLTVTVDGVATNPADEAVTANNDEFGTDEDTAISGNVLDDNGSGADEIPDFLRSVTLDINAIGDLTLDSDGSFTYDPSGAYQHLAAGEFAIDTFTYIAEDADGDTGTGTVNVTVTGVNDIPVVENSDLIGAVTEQITPAGNITDNGTIAFSDVDLSDTHNISTIAASAGALGALTASVSADTTGTGTDGVISWNYSVAASAVEFLAKDQTKTEDFTVTLDDGNGGTVDRTVNVTITGTNDEPVVTSSDGAVVTTSDLSSPVTEMLTPLGNLTSNGNIYFNDVDINNSHSISSITVSAGALGSLSSSVSIDTTGSGTGGVISWDYSVPAAAIEYLAQDETKLESFVVTLDDGNGGTVDRTVNVTITGTNDGPVAEPDSSETDADTGITIDVLANDTDIDGDVLTITSASSGSGGSVQIIDNQLLFDPAGEFAHLIRGELEDVILTYSIDDGHGGTDTTTATVTVEGTNTPPDAVDDSITVDEVSGATVNVLDNDIDLDPGEVLTVTNVAVISGNGTAVTDGTSVFWDPGLYEVPSLSPTPNPLWVPEVVPFYDTLAANETATVTLEYIVEDRSAVSDTATVTITVTGENDAPVAGPDFGTTEENTVHRIQVLGSDTDIDSSDTHTLDVVSVTTGAGIASIDDNFLIWDPGSDYDHLPAGESATVVVDYTMSDNHGAASSSIATITVIGSNDTPITFADSGTTDENTVLTLDVLANDTDVDSGDTKTLNTVSVTGGSATIVSNQLVWNPGTEYDYLAPGESATIDVIYTMTDSLGASATGAATITVTGSNDDPVAVIDTASTLENATAITLDLLANDSDVDTNDTQTLSSINFAAGDGSASIVDNQLVWDPGSDFESLAANQATTVVGSYTVSDNHGGSATSTVSITLTGENDAPRAVPDSGQTAADSILLVDVLANDTDVDSNDVLTITAGSSTGGGSVTVVNNQLQFDPNNQFGHLVLGQTENVNLVYSLSDGNGGFDTNTVTVTVTGINTAPIAEDDAAQVNEDVNTVQLKVLDNDVDHDPGEVLTVTNASVLSGGGSVTTDGRNVSWSNNGAFNSLAANETATVELQYTITDNLNASDDATATLTIVGSNDAPQLTPANIRSSASVLEAELVTGSLLEHQRTGSFDFGDVDLSDSHSVTITAGSTGYRGNLTASVTNVSTGDGNGQIQWNYTVVDSALDDIKLGQLEEQNYTLSIGDGHGGTVSHIVNIDLNGNLDVGDVADGNNAPVAVDNSLFTINYDIAGYDFNVVNGHYYKFVPGNLDWFEASAAADAAGGYLATITSAQENTFVDSIASGNTWLAGSDATNEGAWQWSTGPEAGDQFWAGAEDGSAVAGSYQNWLTEVQTHSVLVPTEPNGGNNESHLEIIGSSGLWNDFAESRGYVVELHETIFESFFSNVTFQFLLRPVTSISGWSYNASNQHFYKYVSENLTWDQAKSAAEVFPNSTITDDNSGPEGDGSHRVFGTLATITSQQENDFVSNLIGNSRAWLGASDAASDGTWTWVVGPDNERNTQFWAGDESGSAVAGRYSNWDTAPTTVVETVRIQPDDSSNNQDHLELNDLGLWNDTSYTNGLNYVIEVGGRPGDPDQPALHVPFEDDLFTISGADLLVNDYDLDGDPLVISSVSPTTAGGATLTLTGGNVVFDPGDAYQHLADGNTTTDTFNYTIFDGVTRGSHDTASVTITIRGLNDDPVAVDESGATQQDTALFLNVLSNDTDVDDNTTLTLVTGTTLSANGSAVLASENGDVRYEAFSPTLTALKEGEVLVDAFSYTVKDEHNGADTGTVSVTVTGINDQPIAVTDFASGDEESVITGNVFANDFDPDHDDIASMVTNGTITSTRGASVTLDSNGNFSYTGAHNFSGADSFNYVIKDTFGLTTTGTANITVNGVADTPTVSLASGAAGLFNEVSLSVTAGLTDTSESGSFVFTGVPAGVSIINQHGEDVTAVPISFFGSSQIQDFIMVLPANQNNDFDFDIGVTATSTELDTLSSASAVSNTESITMTFLASSLTVDFTATDQNMWITGDAFLFRDVTTIDILDIQQGGTLVNSTFNAGIAKIDVDLAASIDVDVDLVSTLELNAGSVDAAVPYDIDLTRAYNTNVDILHISSSTNFNSGSSQPGGFDTFGPDGSYSLDLVFDTNLSVDLDINRKTWQIEWSDSGFPDFIPHPTGGHWVSSPLVDWHPRYSDDPSINLFSFDDSDIAGSLFIPPPLDDFLSVDIAWPVLDTSSDPGFDNVFTASGTSDDMVFLNLDVDNLVASRLPVNPFDIAFGGNFGPVDVNVGLELLDADVFGAVNFVQDFELEFDGFTTFLEMEDGTVLPYNLGSNMAMANASQYDANHDGNIDFTLIVAPDTQFTNDTDLGVDLGYSLGLVKPVVDVSILGNSVVDLGGDFMWTFGDRVQVAAIDVFEDTFDFDFDVALLAVPADEGAFLV